VLVFFEFKGYIFDPKSGELSLGEKTVELDMKISKLLTFFIENQGKVVTRDEILDEVWCESIVSDTTLNWSISQLRKALDDDPKAPQFIKTLPKKGYVFLPTAELTSSSPRSETDKKVDLFRYKHIGASIVVVFAILILGIYLSSQEKPKDVTVISDIYPLTSMSGHERGGELSDDGLFAVFLHREAADDRFRIYLKPMLENVDLPIVSANSNEPVYRQSKRQQTAYPVHEDDYDYQQVIWGRDSYQLFAVRGKENECQIVQISLALSRDAVLQVREIVPCNNYYTTKIDYSASSKTLFTVTSLPGEPSKQHLYKYEPHGEKPVLLKLSEFDGSGFKFLDISPFTGELLLLEDKVFRETAFRVYEPLSKELRDLFHVESVYYTAYWANKKNKIWYNWGNETIREYDLITKSNDVILHTTVGWNYDIHPVSKTQAIYTVSDADSSDLLFSKQGEIVTTQTSYAEYGPKYSPSGDTLAYISNQTGLHQIWLQQNGKAFQLTDVDKYIEFQDLYWLEDNSAIAAVAGKTIGLIDIENNAFENLIELDVKPFFPAISKDKSYLSYSAYVNGQWESYVYRKGNNQETYTKVKALPLVNRTYFSGVQLIFSKVDQEGLWSLDLQSGVEQKTWSGKTSQTNWEIVGNTLRYADSDTIYQCQLFEVNACNQENGISVIGKVPNAVVDSFSYSASLDQTVFAYGRRDETNLRIAVVSE
jgi:DNA-binding winged helix-turn-helix (wHTH) protein